MWQRFTERARKVIFYAQEEAQRFGEGYVSTEHMLLGLIRETDSLAARILEQMGISLNRVRAEVEKQLSKGESKPSEDMTLTPRAKRVIDLAYDEARSLGNNYIGTEHLLLGLIREGDGLAARILGKLGAKLEEARAKVVELQAAEPREPPEPRPPGAVETVSSLLKKWRGGGQHTDDVRAHIRAKLVFVVGQGPRVEGFAGFLKGLGLIPLTWEQAWKMTAASAPAICDVVNTAFAVGGALVFLFGPEADVSASEPVGEGIDLRDQLFAAGAAMALEPTRTILLAQEGVDLGHGLDSQIVKIEESPECRRAIASLLAKAGCPVDSKGEERLSAGSIGDPPRSED